MATPAGESIKTLNPVPPTEKESTTSAEDPASFQLLDDVFRLRAADKIQTPLMAFPRSERGVSDYEYFTGQDMDRFTDQAAWHYMRSELKSVRLISNKLAVSSP